MRVEMVKISNIKPYPGNAKKHPKEQIERIANSIREFGFQQPLVIDGEGVIIIGHGRLRAAKKLGLEQVPVVRAEGLSEDQIRALRLADNKTAESEWDLDLLDLELEGIDLDMTQFGFDLNLEDDETEVSEAEVSEVESRVHVGDVWHLGRHKLICGDSTDFDVVKRLMDGQKASILLTDPPYGIKAVESSGHNDGKKAGSQLCHDNKYKPIIGDDSTDTAQAAYDVSLEFSENQIIFGGNYFTDFLSPSRCWIVWDKKVTGSFADGELAWTSFDKNLKIYEFMWSGMRRQGDRSVEGQKRVHPTQKPVGLMADILNDFTATHDTVLDLFGGSGSTLIACEQTERVCYICELDPYYCDVIIARWEKLTGAKAVKED